MLRAPGIVAMLVFCSTLPAYAQDRELSRAEVRIICEVQERLTGLGFAPGAVDGRVGEQTQQAVGSFLAIMKSPEVLPSDQAILGYLKTFHAQHQSPTANDGSTVATRPNDGQIFLRTDGNAIAPLEIRTSAQGYDYFVKLSDAKTEKTVKEFYIRGGSKITTKMPLGNYNLKYATGTQWHSSNCLFGINTLFSKADKIFEFRRSGNEVSGHSIELILQVDGNLSTSMILPEEW